MPEKLKVLVTCEHGGCSVPEEYKPFFKGKNELLKGHRGYDAGALNIAMKLSGRLKAGFFHSTITRLLVDLNRSEGNPRVFSEPGRAMPTEMRDRILRKYHRPYRRTIERYIDEKTGKGHFVLHMSVHTFAPVLNGRTRKADIGLLYDPSRNAERSMCSALKNSLTELLPGFIVRRNYPYLGVSDGLTAHLRKLFDNDIYAGIELEVNQGLLKSAHSISLALISAFGSLGVARADF